MTRQNDPFRLDPGHQAGLASMRRYLSFRAAVMPQLRIGIVAAIIVLACLSFAAVLSGGDASPSGILGALFGIDALEASAIAAAAVIALYVGVPMGMYVHGLIGGYEPLGSDRD